MTYTDLKALSEAATQGVWETFGPFVSDVDDKSIISGIGDHPESESEANAELICALVNAYRDGTLIPATEVEERVKAAVEAERAACAEVAESFTNSAHAALDIAEGRFPSRSVVNDAIAATIRARGGPQ